MLKEIAFYYFSPTGGTKKAGELLCKAMAENVCCIDLAKETEKLCNAETAVIAAPVFAGRIPEFAAEKIKALNGKGKKAITVAVYGNRAFDDALLELNNVAAEAGFCVAASAALIAQHSMVKEVAAGRPDEKDAAEIADFAEKVLEKLAADKCTQPKVTGNFPYREGMNVTATPICTELCSNCGVCVQICPTKAITATDAEIATELDKCMLCLACVANCPAKARILPPPMQEGLNQKLGALKDVRNANEYFV